MDKTPTNDTDSEQPKRERYKEFERQKILLMEQVYREELTWAQYHARIGAMLAEINE